MDGPYLARMLSLRCFPGELLLAALLGLPQLTSLDSLPRLCNFTDLPAFLGQLTSLNALHLIVAEPRWCVCI